MSEENVWHQGQMFIEQPTKETTMLGEVAWVRRHTSDAENVGGRVTMSVERHAEDAENKNYKFL